MPFKSKAQMRALAAKMDRGEFPKAKFDEFAAATPSIKSLPERVKPKAASKPKRKRKP